MTARVRPHRTTRIERRIEDIVLTIRRELKETSMCWVNIGAPAIHNEFISQGISPLPSVRTIGRILERRGALDARCRLRPQPPLPGRYLPDVVARTSELDSFDVVEDLMIGGHPCRCPYRDLPPRRLGSLLAGPKHPSYQSGLCRERARAVYGLPRLARC